ncbi:MAG: DeoR/GlpR family DNA-binding transcription regulator [Atopobiaceae bacterium]|jgi:DeoR/GlpR family transcriptional regulator of sugar metabolism|nr:DeoR/GlpR family DNA-binding transcription regulator [Atopobiaceae bacterium]
MAAKDRHEVIRQLLVAHQQVSVSELSKNLGVTEETIRRDLEKLEGEGFLSRTYGGAIINAVRQDSGIHFYKRSDQFIAEKRSIALKALRLLSGKSSVAVDSSTTAMEVVKLLADRDGMTLLTNSTVVFQALEASNVTVVSCGGEFDRNALALIGRTAEKNLRQFNVDIALLSCKGLSQANGVLDSRESGAGVKRAMVEQAGEVALLADHSKFDKKAFVYLMGLERLDYIVTDEEPSDSWKKTCDEQGIELIY